MKTRVIAFLALALVGCHFQRASPRDVELLEFGTFRETDTGGYVRAPDSVQGRSHAVTDAVLIEGTTDIRASRGTSFGIRVKFTGEPAGVIVPCTAKCFHPKFADPTTQRTSEVEQWENFGTIGSAGYIGYTFDYEWELVPGQWTIQLFVGSKLKAEKTFNVIVAPST